MVCLLSEVFGFVLKEVREAFVCVSNYLKM